MFIADPFVPVMKELDKTKDATDMVFFDGGSIMQLAGRIIQAKHPRVTVVHGLEHVLALAFECIAKTPVVKVGCCVAIFFHMSQD